MEYILRPPFFIIAPYSRFSDAWEAFCKKLLELEHDTTNIQRLTPPDLGADLIWTQKRIIYQCKSSENENFNVTKAKNSLKQAFKNRKALGKWESYIICINGDITGKQFAQIQKIVSEECISNITISYLDGDYWINLCKKFPEKVNEHFNVLVPATKMHVVEALEHERYFPHYVKRYADAIDLEDFKVIVSTNRAKIKFEIPFSKTMTIKHLLDVIKGIIRLPDGWSLYPKFGTSAAINRLSITKENKQQVFSKTLEELGVKSGEELQFFIQVIWSDNLEEKGTADAKGEIKYVHHLMHSMKIDIPELELAIQKMSYQERKQNTLEAFKGTLHDTIWNAASRLTGI